MDTQKASIAKGIAYTRYDRGGRKGNGSPAVAKYQRDADEHMRRVRVLIMLNGRRLIDLAQPTKYAPGTEWKCAVLCARYTLGIMPFVPGDCDEQPEPVPTHRAKRAPKRTAHWYLDDVLSRDADWNGQGIDADSFGSFDDGD